MQAQPGIGCRAEALVRNVHQRHWAPQLSPAEATRPVSLTKS
ncbi:hypothetical protein WKW80_28550 [Variovorax humicola]|uniref:Uncharacterized protein n=1 Tax=Variovorax humicola TaxID=1769758 RepID=A0ABU8W7D7_9BURK